MTGRPETESARPRGPAATVWIDGAFVDPESARISAFDAGVQHAVGLFETMIARGGEVVHLGRHLRRLRASAAELRLSTTLRLEPLAEAVRAAVARSGLGDARIRLTMTGGDLNLLARSGGRGGPPTLIVVVQPATRYPETLFERGGRLAVADARLNPLDPFASHKTLAYWHRLSALQDALAKRCDEALWLSVTNHVCGGSVSNLVVVRDGVVLSPQVRGEEPAGALRSPVLPGVVRSQVLEWAAEEGRSVERRLLTIEDVLKAEEVCLLNSSWGVMPIVAVEAAEIGDGRVGEAAAGWRARWNAPWPAESIEDERAAEPSEEPSSADEGTGADLPLDPAEE